MPRITTITDWPSQTLTVKSKGVAKLYLLFFNVLHLIPQISWLKRGIILSQIYRSRSPLTGFKATRARPGSQDSF